MLRCLSTWLVAQNAMHTSLYRLVEFLSTSSAAAHEFPKGKVVLGRERGDKKKQNHENL